MQFRVQGLRLRECVQYNGGGRNHASCTCVSMWVHSQLGFRVHHPKPPQAGSSGFLLPFDHISKASRQSSRTVPATRQIFRQITRPSCPARVSRSVNIYPEGNILTQNPRRDPKHANNKKNWGRNVKRSRAFIVPVNREALAWLTVLSRRSAGGGGLGRSLECPCKWSAALSAV